MENLRYTVGAFFKYCPVLGVVGGGGMILDAWNPLNQRVHGFATRYLYQTERPRAIRLIEGVLCCIPFVNTVLGIMALVKGFLFPSRPADEIYQAMSRPPMKPMVPLTKATFMRRVQQVKELGELVDQFRGMTEEQREAFYISLYAQNALLAEAIESCFHSKVMDIAHFLEGMKNFVLGGKAEALLQTLQIALTKKEQTAEQKAFQTFKQHYEALEDPMGWISQFVGNKDDRLLLAACTLAELKIGSFLEIYKNGKRQYTAIMRSFQKKGSKTQLEKDYAVAIQIHFKMRAPLTEGIPFSLYDYCSQSKLLLEGERNTFQEACGKNALHSRFVLHFYQPSFAKLQEKIKGLSERYEESARQQAEKEAKKKRDDAQELYTKLSLPETQLRYQKLKQFIEEETMSDTLALLRQGGKWLSENEALAEFIQHLTPLQFRNQEPGESFCNHFLAYTDDQISKFLSDLQRKHTWLHEQSSYME